MIDPTVQKAFKITHASEISAARRYGQQLAESLGFGATESGKLAIVVTEAGTNILKHAGDGVLLLTPVQRNGQTGIEILALDRGPGIVNVIQSLRDGISTTGTAGTGLGAMRRLSNEFDVYSAPGRGSAFYLCLWSSQDKAGQAAPDVQDRIVYGAVCQPVAGEEECGDGWAVDLNQDCATILVVDGLGHGPDAALAARLAVKTLQAHADLQPGPLIESMHEALRITRGAAASVAKLDMRANHLAFAGIGNVAACILDGTSRKQLVSHNGIVGHNMRKVQEFALPCPIGALCILCTDGITTQWDLSAYPGLSACHPSLIAGILYRDCLRPRDDATVLVIKRLS